MIEPVQMPTCETCGASEWERRELHDNSTFIYRLLAEDGGSVWHSTDLDAPHIETTFVCVACTAVLDGSTESGQAKWQQMYEMPCDD
jgi:hypothetical protein